MSRLKRLRNINDLIDHLQIIKNQCSLSEMDANLLKEALAKLSELKSKKGLTDKHYRLEVADIVQLILRFLVIK